MGYKCLNLNFSSNRPILLRNIIIVIHYHLRLPRNILKEVRKILAALNYFLTSVTLASKNTEQMTYLFGKGGS